MLNRIRNYISRHRLLSDGLYIVALSGGADSVCLLRIMKALGYRIEAVHCNFKLRGEESDRDEMFCKSLCREQDVPLHRIHFDTKEYARLHRVSIEMAARELRYTYFEQLRVAIGAEAVVVAHHRDDSIETMLLNIIRGTGIHGMEGIKPRNGNIIRPLLCISREEILQYLDSIGQGYINDSSNFIDDVQRNKLRLHIIPLLKTINPAALDNIQKSMEHMAGAVSIYDEAVSKCKEACIHGDDECKETYIKRYEECSDGGLRCKSVSIPTLSKQAAPETVLYEILRDYGCPGVLAEQIYESLDAPVGKVWQWDDWTLAKDRDSLIIDKTPEPLPEMRIPETGTYIYIESRTLEEGEYSPRSTKLALSLAPRTEDFSPSKEPFTVTLDADDVVFPLTVRPVRVGDAFRPYGMKGRKLVSDYLTDCKANYFERQRQLVVEDANGTIIWLVGRRTSQNVSVTNDTINILTMRYFNA